MDLVDEKDVAFHQVGQHRREIAGALQGGTRGHAKAGTQLLRDDHRHGRLTQPRRAGQQHVIGSDVALLRAVEHERELFADLWLPDELVETARAQGLFDVPLPRVCCPVNVRVVLRRRLPAGRAIPGTRKLKFSALYI